MEAYTSSPGGDTCMWGNMVVHCIGSRTLARLHVYLFVAHPCVARMDRRTCVRSLESVYVTAGISVHYELRNLPGKRHGASASMDDDAKLRWWWCTW